MIGVDFPSHELLDTAPPAKPLPMAPEVARRFGQDLDYHAWNFGGAALWPLPAAGTGSADDAQRLLLHGLRDQERWWSGENPLRQSLCRVLCPWREAARVAFNLGLLALLGATAAYFCSARLHAMGWRYLSRLLAVGVALVALFLRCSTATPSWRRCARAGCCRWRCWGWPGCGWCGCCCGGRCRCRCRCREEPDAPSPSFEHDFCQGDALWNMPIGIGVRQRRSRLNANPWPSSRRRA